MNMQMTNSIPAHQLALDAPASSLMPRTEPQQPRPKRKYKKRAPPKNAFPRRLYQMLMDAEKEGNEHIVSWIQNGAAFQVHDQDMFAAIILPRYFRLSKYRSFQRQLNNYKIERYTSGPLRGAYHHFMLQKGNEQLSSTLIREIVPEIHAAQCAMTLNAMGYAPSSATVLPAPTAIVSECGMAEQSNVPTVSDDDDSSRCTTDEATIQTQMAFDDGCDYFASRRFYPVDEADSGLTRSSRKRSHKSKMLPTSFLHASSELNFDLLDQSTHDDLDGIIELLLA